VLVSSRVESMVLNNGVISQFLDSFRLYGGRFSQNDKKNSFFNSLSRADSDFHGSLTQANND
jgi:hypothetical protein